MPIWSPAFFGSASASGYVIEGSGSFNGTDGKLTRTISSAGNRRTFILEVIFKRGGSASSFLTAFSSGTDTFYWYLSSDQVYIQNYESATQMELKSDAVLKDFTAWYHLIVAIDTTQPTDTNRVKAWVNGVELTWASSPRTYPAENLELKWNTGSQEHQIGHSSTTYSDDYFARAASYDGFTMTDPVTNGFGEYDDNGVWVPKNPSDLTGKVLISQGTGSAIGTMDTRTSAAFDGNNNQDENNAASHSSAATTVTLGKDFGSGNAKTVTQVKAFGYSGGGFTSNASENCTITVIGSNTGLGSDEVTLATSGTISDTTDSNPQTISFSNSTAYRYVYIKLTQSPSNYFFVAELEFYEEGTLGFGTTGFLIEGGSAFTNGTDSSSNSQNFTKGGTITDVDDTLTDKASDNFGNHCTLNASNPLSHTLAEGNLKATAGATGRVNYGTIAIPTTGKWYWEAKVVSQSPNQGAVGIKLLSSIVSTNTDFSLGSGGYGMFQANNSGLNGHYFENSGTTVPGGGASQNITWAVNDIVNIAYSADDGKIWFGKNNTYYSSFTNGTSTTVGGSSNFGSIPSGVYVPAVAGTSGGGASAYLFNFGATAFSYTPPTGYKAINTANLPAPTVTDPSAYFGILTWQGNGTDDTTIRDGETVDGVAVGGALKDKGGAGTRWTPDFSWIKNRAADSTSWVVSDVVRGVTKNLATDTSAAEDDATRTTQFVAGGIEVGNSNFSNKDGSKTIGYFWKAGGAATAHSVATANVNGATSSTTTLVVDGNSGTIAAGMFVAGSGVDAGVTVASLSDQNNLVLSSAQSISNDVSLTFSTSAGATIATSVSAADHGGFSVGTFTAVSGTMKIGHGLSRKPDFIWVKNRGASGQWWVFHRSIGHGKYLVLGATGESAEASSTDVWANTDPDSSTFSSNSTWLGTSGNYSFMALAKTPGLIGAGTYTGNAGAGGTNGPFVVVDDGASGFSPAFVMFKNTNASQSWEIHDIGREPYNIVAEGTFAGRLQPDTNAAESTTFVLQKHANGFKIVTGGASTNGSGNTFVYIAFAEHPFGGDGVAQAKAL